MSTNIHILAERTIQVVSTGQITVQGVYFKGIWQTPTEVTNRIMKSPCKMTTYRDYVMYFEDEYEESVYAPDDVFCEGLVIGSRTRNSSLDHLKELDKWVAEVTSLGYTITFEAW